MKILAIETSCDETAMAVVSAQGGLNHPRFSILENIVSSQVKIHRPFGGIVPNLAKREHIKNLPIVFQKIGGDKLKQQIDLLSVTIGPGLEPALWTGINFAKNLSQKWKKPLIGVNHLEGHLYSFLLPPKTKTTKPDNAGQNSKLSSAIKTKKLFPAVALIVSGGHTILLLMKDLVSFKKLGETRDDAGGEAFDKVARMLNLPYPGGPEIEKLAKLGSPQAIDFPRPMIYAQNYDFSFAGLKTSVWYYLRDKKITDGLKADVAAGFQQAAIDVLTHKTIKAAKDFQAKTILLSGGVAANKKLKISLARQARALKHNFFSPVFRLNTDNAAMIGAAAYINYLKKGEKTSGRIVAKPNLGL